MSEFTYQEITDKNEKYETYEWDNVWISHADELSRNRVLYIGDSISCGIRNIATRLSDEKILFDGFGTSKGIDNPFFKDSLKLFAAQESKREAVIFNNGLHGWHLDDDTEYRYYYEEMIKFLLEEFKGTPLIIVLTTHIANEAREERVKVRNKVAGEIARKYGLPVIDLYKAALDSKELLYEDGVHFVTEGYNKLADFVVKSVAELAPGIKA